MKSITGVMIAGALSGPALAGPPDADIDELSASLREGGRGWQLDVEYEIEFEGHGTFVPELQLRILQDDRCCITSGGEFVLQVPLDRPIKQSRRDVVFRDLLSFKLPSKLFRSTDDLRLEARIIHGRQTLDARRRRIHVRSPDVDFDRLRGEACASGDQWRVVIQYELETEDVDPTTPLRLHIELTDRQGRLLRCAAARTRVLLSHPTKVDDDEREYRGRIELSVPAFAAHRPRDLRIRGRVTFCDSNRTLASRKGKVR
jgi:hypothetical protein